MKKGLKALLLAMCVFFAVSGCGTAKNDVSDSALSADGYSKYLTLGTYKGLTVTAEKAPITDEDVNELKEEYLDSFVKYADKAAPAEMGDMINLNVICREKNENGEVLYDFLDGYDLTIGDADFSKEYDEALIGKSTGDVFECVISVPEDFEDSILCGRDVWFKTEITGVSETIEPELTDEVLKELGVSSEAELEEKLVNELEESRDAEYIEDLRLRLVNAVIDNCEITGIDDSMYKMSLESLKQEYQNMADSFGIDIESLYESLGLNEETLEEDAKRDCYEKMAISLIAKAESISISDDEFSLLMEKFAEDNDYDSVDAVFEEYTPESLKDYFLEEKVVDFLYDNAVIQ